MVKVFHLLQHRVRRTRLKHIAGQQQQRQPVHMRDRSGGDHIGSSRPYGTGNGHDALAEQGFAIGNRAMRHGLFIVGAVGGQLRAFVPQRFAQACHIAVTKDGKHPCAIGLHAAIVHFHPQCGQVLYQRLAHGQSLCCHGVSLDERAAGRLGAGVALLPGRQQARKIVCDVLDKLGIAQRALQPLR